MKAKSEKEKLLAKLANIEKQEAEELERIHYPELCDKYLGKYFRFKHYPILPKNKSDFWYSYIKVVDIGKQDFYYTKDSGFNARYLCYSFEIDNKNVMRVEPERFGNIKNLTDEISQEEFNKVWYGMLSLLKKNETDYNLTNN